MITLSQVQRSREGGRLPRTRSLNDEWREKERFMAIKDVLVHLDTSAAGKGVAEFALSLAAQTGAHVTAAGIATMYMPPVSADYVGSYEAIAEKTEERRAVAEKAYENFAAAAPAGVQTELVIIETISPFAKDRFGKLGRHFDLSIVGQSSPDSGEENSLVQGAIFGSGRPVFIVPFVHKGPAKLGKALVCWDGGVPAARAIAGVMPLLQRSGKVEVVRMSEKEEFPEELPGFNITRHLARHGINATLTSLPSANDVGNVILSYAAESGADYIVMGGYGHWKLTEFVLGGTTRTILSSMTAPVFMAH
jgi:nucleotide-binding universal stress UspA family protein